MSEYNDAMLMIIIDNMFSQNLNPKYREKCIEVLYFGYLGIYSSIELTNFPVFNIDLF